ncbi:MAG: radical SAM protein [Acetobacteraceae bacterium]|nr:radical SAM protein [Acetobacteraceae bacterium]
MRQAQRTTPAVAPGEAQSVRQARARCCQHRAITPPGLRLVWEVTAHCSQACLHCFRPRPRELWPELETGQALRVLSDMARAGVKKLVFTGGEPLCRPDLFILATEAGRLGMLVELFTSGQGLGRAEADVLAQAARLECTLSLDGACADVHDRMRGTPGSFAAATRALRALAGAEVPVDVVMVVTRLNFHQAGAVADLAWELGASSVSFWELRPYGRARRNLAWLELGPAETSRWLESIAQKREEYGPRGLLIETVRAGPSAEDPGCDAGRDLVALDPQGHYHPCTLLRAPRTILTQATLRPLTWILARGYLAWDRPDCGRREGKGN